MTPLTRRPCRRGRRRWRVACGATGRASRRPCRRAYRTPLHRLFLGSAAAFPGGAVRGHRALSRRGAKRLRTCRGDPRARRARRRRRRPASSRRGPSATASLITRWLESISVTSAQAPVPDARLVHHWLGGSTRHGVLCGRSTCPRRGSRAPWKTRYERGPGRRMAEPHRGERCVLRYFRTGRS